MKAIAEREFFRRVASYVDRILHGALEIAQSVLVRADQVIG